MEKPKVSNLKVSSHSEKYSNFENQNNNFRVKIPPNLNFNQPNLHVGVSSITFPNRFRTLPSKTQKYMCIITLQEDLKISNIKKVLVPEGSYESSDDLLDSLNYQLVKNKVTHISFDNTYQTKKKSNSSNHHCVIRCLQKSTIIVLPLHLSILLGLKKDLLSLNEKGDYHWGDVELYNRFQISTKMINEAESKSLNIVQLVKNSLSELDPEAFESSHFIGVNSDESYYFDHAVNIYEFRPKYFLLYNNICEHSIYDSKFLRVLKIVPVKESDSEYVTLEFENEEYFKIQVSHPNFLEFVLRSHTGEMIQFHDKKENVIVDLSFKIIL